jgi:hypothetical protein
VPAITRLFLVVLCSAAALPQPAQGQVAAAAGHRALELLPGRCFDVHLDEWTPPQQTTGESFLMAPPPRIRFTTDDLPTGWPTRPGMLVLPAPGAMPSMHRITAWTTTGPDSVRVVWTTGFAGVTAELALVGDGLHGRARYTTDVLGPTRPETQLRAVPVACDAPLPPEHRMAWERVRGVALAEGDSVRIGETLPADLPRQLAPGAQRSYVVDAATAGDLEGAAEVVVTLDGDGVVRRIRVHLPHADMDETAVRLSARHGAPTGIRTIGGRWRHWGGRMIDVSIMDAYPGPGINVTLSDPRFR